MSELRSSETLSIGDVAVVIASTFHPEHVGRECFIVGELKERLSKNRNEMIVSYLVDIDGEEWLARPQNLRKKRPPREDLQLVRWSECPWQPETINV